MNSALTGGSRASSRPSPSLAMLNERVPADEVSVFRALGEDDVQESQRQRGIGPGNRSQVGVGGIGGSGPDRVDHNQVRTILACRGDATPEVMVGGQGVAAPQDDEL